MSNEIMTLTDEFCIKEYGWTKSQFDVVQNTYFKGLSSDEIKIFGHVCKHTGLDPFLKQIYPVLRSGKMTIQTAIDGYRLIAERTGKYSPGREPTFTYDKNGLPASSTSYVKKMTNDGTWHEVAATAYFTEYNPGIGPFWKKMPHTMIAKCAEALALRKAFPAELSAVRTCDEMDQADIERLPKAVCDVIDTKTYHNESVTIPRQDATINNSQQQELTKEPIETIKPALLSNDQVETLSKNYVMTDLKFKENFTNYMSDKWNAVTFNDIPEAAYSVALTSMMNNINMQKQQVTK